MTNNHHEPCVEVVLFDAMYTLIEARGSRKKLLARIFRDELRKPVNADRLWRITKKERQSMPPSSDFRRDWKEFNRRILSHYGVSEEKVSAEMCDRIRRRILYDFRLYEVKPDMRQLINELKKLPVILGIDSNQDDAGLQIMLGQLGLQELFEPKYIFTSQRLDDLSKPHLEHFAKIAEALKLKKEPCKIVLVGNSLRNDAPATKIGQRVIILDRDRSKKREFVKGQLSLPLNTKLFFAASPNEVLALVKGWR